MRLFQEIHLAYLATDGFLLQRQNDARTQTRSSYWRSLRSYNDHAYFVMLFAQLEQHIHELCARLVRKKKASGKWKSRRLWDSVDPDRLPFMRKVGLVTDKSQAAYARIETYYETRCKIAHGDSASVGSIAFPLVAKDLQTLAKSLHAT